MYQYRATVVRIIDGDTYVVDFDLGFRAWLRDQEIRLAHANSPEKNTAEGRYAAQWVAMAMPVGSPVVVNTIKPTGDKEKYGRWLAAITLPGDIDLATSMIFNGQAVPYEGGPR